MEGKNQPPLPPLLRKTNWRELMQILRAHRQIGLPCSVNTGASLGWALYAYTSVRIFANHCNGAQNILLRVLGSRSKGSEALKSSIPQRAMCGVCPCCVRATHVLIPATYEAGSFDCRKASAVGLWQLYGPMASRTYAAAVYFNQFG